MTKGTAETDRMDPAPLERILERYPGGEGSLIPVLQEVQEAYGYVPRPAVERIAERLKVFPSRIYGVLTFYTQFRLEPKGRHVLRVCCGTACHVKGAERISSKLREVLGVSIGGTTPDRRFTLEQVACIGAREQAPAVMVGDEVHGQVTPDEAPRILERYE